MSNWRTPRPLSAPLDNSFTLQLDSALYFDLAAQFRTQDEPTFCGLSTLVMCLNTLRLDPGRHWKGPWRWYHETMLDCCLPVEEVRANGITLDEFVCLARCNGATARLHRPGDGHEATLESFREKVRASCELGSAITAVSYNRATLGQR